MIPREARTGGKIGTSDSQSQNVDHGAESARLELMLAADLVRSAVAPTWDDIGKLAAIAAIRTVLGFFLGRDLETEHRLASARTSEANA